MTERWETRRLRNEDNFQSGPDLPEGPGAEKEEGSQQSELGLEMQRRWEGWRETKTSLPSMTDGTRKARDQKEADGKVSPREPGERGCPGTGAVGSDSHHRHVMGA